MAGREDQLKCDPGAQDLGESPAAQHIQNDIDRTRARMDDTIDELGARLNPKNWFEAVSETVTSAISPEQISQMGSQVGRASLNALKNHPVPALCIGLGVAWLIAEQIRSRRSGDELEMYGGSYVDARTGEPYTTGYGREFRGDLDDIRQQSESGMSAGDTGGSSGGAISGMTQRASGMMSKAAESASDMMGKAKEKIGNVMGGRLAHAGEYVHHAYDSSRQTVAHTIDDYPLAAVGGAFAVGLVAGLAMPSCSWENRAYGRYAAQLKRRVKETGKEIYQDSKRIVRDEAERHGLTPEALKERGREMADNLQECVGGAARDMAEEARSAARETAEQISETAESAASSVTKGRKNKNHGNGRDQGR